MKIPEDDSENTDIENIDTEDDIEDFSYNNDGLSKLLENMIHNGEKKNLLSFVDEDTVFEKVLSDDFPSTSTKINIDLNFKRKMKKIKKQEYQNSFLFLKIWKYFL